MRLMLTTLIVVLPVFALIFSGWGAFKLKILGPHAIAELNRFVVYLALPTLLFDIMANTHGSELWQPGFIAVFLLSSAIAFALPFLVRLRGRLPLADTALDGLNAAYPNTGYMGIPLSMIAFGSGVLAATTITIIITMMRTRMRPMMTHRWCRAQAAAARVVSAAVAACAGACVWPVQVLTLDLACVLVVVVMGPVAVAVRRLGS